MVSSKSVVLPVFYLCLGLSGALSGAFSGPVSASQTPSAKQLLERSIAHHDPQGRWAEGVFKMNFVETRPDGGERFTDVTIDNRRGRFAVSTTRDGANVDGNLRGGECMWRLDGSADFTDEDREKYRLTCDDLMRMSNYYVYLWGMPMKLMDPGTRLDETVDETEFMGKDVWSIRVTYDESVGTDTWFFYFNPEDAALVGYRFFHDEVKGDGEYIILEGELDFEGLRLPAVRTWYTNMEDKLLGTDTLRPREVSP
jgi:hypothetical protein